MICVIVGYEGSQKLVKASKWLAQKYLPRDFQLVYLNYTGEINGWSKYISDFLSYLPDEQIIFALDDYLIADELDKLVFYGSLPELYGDIVCIKLCESTEQEHEEYPVTTQWCVWNKKYLMSLLGQVKQPWQFELQGSFMFDKICLHRPCLKYFTNSSISSRWDGVKLDGLKTEDIDYIKTNHLINE